MSLSSVKTSITNIICEDFTSKNENVNKEYCQNCDTFQAKAQNLHFQLTCARNELTVLKNMKCCSFKVMTQI